ncbi:uncharacterized protein C2orf80 homolog isoform X1 [Mixophyes fleayi]|uniref:uncharacterized protein C2orf80 homolog isoform X1 n=1 Tax=Mixophyes fleayi TaxID=3061075 RepID=UPI003F4DCCB1
MERKFLRKEIEKLLGNYVSTTLREMEFDPKGRRDTSSIADLAHYDLAISVAMQWLNSSKSNEALKKGRLKLALNHYKYPNRMERKAMILSSFAGLLMHSFPVEDVFEIYGSKPSTTQLQNSAKAPRSIRDLKGAIFFIKQGHLTQPFSLSLHPFAMLTAPQAAKHALKHCARLCKTSGRNETISPQTQVSDTDQHEISPDGEETSTESETGEDTIAKAEIDIDS